MIEKIIHQGYTLAIIVRSTYKSDGIEFFTPDDFSQQIGYMKREKGYVIVPHKHLEVEKVILQTFETLIVRKGKIKVSLYDQLDDLVEECIIGQGDVVLLSGYGHGFEMLEDSEIIEVKQGPYIAGYDKIAICGAKSSVSEWK